MPASSKDPPPTPLARPPPMEHPRDALGRYFLGHIRRENESVRGSGAASPQERYLVFKGKGEEPPPGHPPGEVVIYFMTLNLRYTVPLDQVQRNDRAALPPQEGTPAWFVEVAQPEWDALAEEGKTPSGASGGVQEVVLLLRSKELDRWRHRSARRMDEEPIPAGGAGPLEGRRHSGREGTPRGRRREDSRGYPPHQGSPGILRPRHPPSGCSTPCLRSCRTGAGLRPPWSLHRSTAGRTLRHACPSSGPSRKSLRRPPSVT